jgi:hypothetical protein
MWKPIWPCDFDVLTFVENSFTDGNDISALRAGSALHQENSWHSFLLEAQSAPGQEFGWKREIN